MPYLIFLAIDPLLRVDESLILENPSQFLSVFVICVDLLYYGSKTTGKREQYDRMAGKKLDGKRTFDRQTDRPCVLLRWTFLPEARVNFYSILSKREDENIVTSISS